MASPPDVRPFVALLIYPPACIAAAVSAKKEDATKTVFWVFFIGVMFLPELVAFDAPLIPPLGKYEISGVMGVVAAIIVHRDRIKKSKPLRGVDLFFVIALLGGVGTILTNKETLEFGFYWWDNEGNLVQEPTVLNGHIPKDVLVILVRDGLSVFVPFFLGRAVFKRTGDAHVLCKGIVTIALIYAPGALLEARISPQIHHWLYGYHPTGFAGVVRGDGFKPVLFQNSGLSVATFFFTAVVCAAILHKRKEKVFGVPAIGAMVFLMVVLALSHNMAALIYTLAAVPVVLLSRGKLAATASVALAIAVLLYPPIRGGSMIDVFAFIDWLAQYSPERADSLHVRFYNEDILYERASERLTFGWGGYGRSRVYDERGKDICLTDGEWIITLGGRGIMGFIGLFGLILSPLFISFGRAGKIPLGPRQYLDGISIICAFLAVDLLPNALFTKLPYFLSGVLLALSSGLIEEAKEAKERPGGGGHGGLPPPYPPQGYTVMPPYAALPPGPRPGGR
ncbi:MAG: hypothetical protein AAGA54_15405 [Myxococcota bacterium]